MEGYTIQFDGQNEEAIGSDQIVEGITLTNRLRLGSGDSCLFISRKSIWEIADAPWPQGIVNRLPFSSRI
jgi:hypothetical protein